MKEHLIQHLLGVRAGRITLDEFELWLVGKIDNCPGEADKEVQMYIDRLDALLIQLGEGIVSRGELEEEIEDILRSLTTIRRSIIEVEPEEFTEEAVNSKSITQPFSLAGATQDYRLPTFVVE